MGEYLRPSTVEEALHALNFRALTVVAGGTDFYPARVGRPLNDDVLDISTIHGLRGIADNGDHWRIGACTTWTDVIRADLPPWFDGLKLAAREVGGVQIQNAGTVCGNLCNASPAADGVPPLLSMGASVELASAEGSLLLPLEDFVLGNRETACRADQMMTGIIVPKPTAERSGGHFLKLGARKYLVISIVMVGATLSADASGRIESARVAVGACSAAARRLPALEAALVGRMLGDGLGDVAASAHLDPLSPIDDVRGSADYRNDVALTLVRRTLNDLGARL